MYARTSQLAQISVWIQASLVRFAAIPSLDIKHLPKKAMGALWSLGCRRDHGYGGGRCSSKVTRGLPLPQLMNTSFIINVWSSHQR